MRTLAFLGAVASIFAISPAAAQRQGAWYVGGDFGAMVIDDTSFDVGAPDNGSLVLDHDYGFDGALFVGYDLGAFRIESEVSYRTAQLDEFTTHLPLHNTSGVFHPVGTHQGGGSTSALSFMLNGMLDFGDDDGISGFVGGGAGVARVDYNNLRSFTNDGVFLDDHDERFAWQLFAGVRQAVSDRVDVHLRYRFFNVGDLELHGPPGGSQIDGRFRSHSLLAGLTFNFGRPE